MWRGHNWHESYESHAEGRSEQYILNRENRCGTLVKGKKQTKANEKSGFEVHIVGAACWIDHKIKFKIPCKSKMTTSKTKTTKTKTKQLLYTTHCVVWNVKCEMCSTTTTHTFPRSEKTKTTLSIYVIVVLSSKIAAVFHASFFLFSPYLCLRTHVWLINYSLSWSCHKALPFLRKCQSNYVYDTLKKTFGFLLILFVFSHKHIRK